ncbi:TIGR02391 family protein [Sphingobium sp. YC-XJ3]|uniref:TIGR02391 family protein n=1 Tax=Sphingobium sp. YC-XJ3 TaxID=3024245 RepID=UPI00235EF2C6|nr:TIGR02391 family protein [Sphingobium sp. YC-XJ3]WDA35119.1 TIGR02391 family protein [Sphingobium sp. YC-XJ3]
MTAARFFSQGELQAIADALGHADIGLSNPEIELLIRSAKMVDPGKTTKRVRIYNAFVESQNSKRNRTHILEFIRLAMAPARHSREPQRFEPMRAALNQALAFAGLAVDETGKLSSGEAATTLPEAQRRARDLRDDMEGRGVHPDVLAFCRAELLADNYFHAVQEAVKSVADKMRCLSGLSDDGAGLVDKSLGGEAPLLAINARSTVSQKSEQSGFANLVKGAFGMFRNPTAHEARIHWTMTKDDAEDLLTIVSLIHRRLDAAHRRPCP